MNNTVCARVFGCGRLHVLWRRCRERHDQTLDYQHFSWPGGAWARYAVGG